MSSRSCGISRFVLWRSDRDCWWFRRAVPGDLVGLIGKREWRQTLKASSRADAEREAIPLLDETNRTIDLALAGNWPPVSDDEIEAIAVGWWSEFRETRLSELRRNQRWAVDRLWDVNASEWALADEEELARSVGQFIAGPRNLDYIFRPELDLIQAILDDPKRASGLVRNKDAMRRLLRDCRLNHHAVAGGWGDDLRERDRATDRVLAAIHAGKLEPHEIVACMIEKQVTINSEPQARKAGARSPVLLNDPNGGDDLIAKWAKWRKPRPKTIYETRRIMRKLTDFVEFDDLARLTKADVERWLEHLDEAGAAPKTLEGHLLTLKTLANFAVEKDMISDNPIAKIRYRAKANPRKKIRAYTNAEARTVLAATRFQRDYMRWLPWLACFTGARLDEIAAADVRDIERVGRYWVLNIRLDHRAEDASIKTESSHRRVPLHEQLLEEGFLSYVRGLPKDGPLFPTLRADKFGSKGGTATKKIGPFVRSLAANVSSLADHRLSPNHSWRHRLINECRRIPIREDIEHALIGHAQEGTAPDYGEFAINTMLGPAIDKTRSPFDIRSEAGDGEIGDSEAVLVERLQPTRTAVTDIGSLLNGMSAEVSEPAGGVLDERESEAATWAGKKQVFLA
jgi:integrase